MATNRTTHICIYFLHVSLIFTFMCHTVLDTFTSLGLDQLNYIIFVELCLKVTCFVSFYVICVFLDSSRTSNYISETLWESCKCIRLFKAFWPSLGCAKHKGTLAITSSDLGQEYEQSAQAPGKNVCIVRFCKSQIRCMLMFLHSVRASDLL